MDIDKKKFLEKQDDAMINKVIDALFAEGYQKNANEVVHTGNTNAGAELIPSTVLSNQILDMVQERPGGLLSMLKGDHGRDMNKTEEVSVVGELGYFLGNTEWTTGAGTIAQGNKKTPTDKVTITQGQFIASIDLSKRELNYAVGDLEGLVKSRLALAMADTIDAIIINGDSEAGATGNVNSDDGAPTSTNYYMQNDHGIRELGINGTGTSVNLGTLASADFLSLISVLGNWAVRPEDCLFISDRFTYNKALGLADFADAAQRGAKSTVEGAAITNVFGSDYWITKHVPKTEADGKVSTTGSNNTLGQLLYVYKPAIQYGFGQPLELDVVKVPGKGISIIATFEFGFGIAQKLGGHTDSSVAVGYNVTI